MILTLFVSSDTLIRLDELTDQSDGSYVNDATVTMTLKTDALVNVTGAVALALTYVAASDGRYQGAIPDTVSLTEGGRYWLDITATSSGGEVRFDRIRCHAKYAAGS